MHAELPAQEQITAVIPIRGGSERCLSKSIRPFYDTCLLDLRVKVLRQTKGIHRIQVTRCDAVLARRESLELCSNAKLAMLRVKRTARCCMRVSSACPTGIMLIAFAPTPFIEASDYDTVSMFSKNKTMIVSSVFNTRKIICSWTKKVNFDPLKTRRSQDLPATTA